MRNLFLLLTLFLCSASRAATDSTVYTITAQIYPVAAGQVNGAGSYPKGSFVTLEAIPVSGFTFGYWSLNGMITSMNTTFPLVVDTDLVVQATFLQQPDSFLVTANAFPVNAGIVSGTGIYKNGDTAVVTAHANAGYTFNNWQQNGIIVSTDTTYAFAVTANIHLNASYQQLPIHVTISTQVFPSDDAGTTTGGGIYNQGDTVHLTASAQAGYVFANWQVLGIIASSDSAYTFIATGDMNLHANFIPLTYTITTNALPAQGGTVLGGGSTSHGSTVTLQAFAYNGYAFDYWEENSTELSRLSQYSFTATADRTITARFKLLTSIEDNKIPDIIITPNFGSGPFSIAADNTYQLQLFNYAGQEILTRTLAEGNNTIEISNPGLYILQLTNNEGVTVTKKLLVQ